MMKTLALRTAIACVLLLLPINNTAQAQLRSVSLRDADSMSQVYRSYRPSLQPTGLQPTGLQRMGNTASDRSKTERVAYRLDAGDVVAVIVFGITGEYSDMPVHMPKGNDGTLPAVGNPMVVMPDGTLPMPLLDPINVRGLSITQARDILSRAYVQQNILTKERQVSLSLMRKRTVNVSVLHDNPTLAMRSVAHVKIPADRPRVLEALAAAGPYDRDASVRVIRSGGKSYSSRSTLSNGDVVHIQSPSQARFFTGGILRGGAYSLPPNRPVNALQAMSTAGGVTSNRSAIGPTQVMIVRQSGGTIRTSYANLLRNPQAFPMRPGDTLIVR